jgi:tRNA(fMet)-specific endonuclease VapC
VTYLLDTNACIALINGSPALVRTRFEGALSQQDKICVSSIVAFELWYGVAKSSRPDKNGQRLASFLSAPMEIVAFDDQDAAEAGAQRAILERIGKPIGAYDLLIAGQALRRGWTVVTANVSEFGRIKALQWEDWATS